MKVLVPLHGFTDWNGGIDLIRLLIRILEDDSEQLNFDLYFTFPKRTFLQKIWRAADSFIVNLMTGRITNPLYLWKKWQQLDQIGIELLSNRNIQFCGTSTKSIQTLANEIKADIVFPLLKPLPHKSVPSIGYIFDFQHLHMPHLFSKKQLASREKMFRDIVFNTDGILVNSNFVKNDLITKYNVPDSKIFKLPFIPHRTDGVTIDLLGTLEKFKINSKTPYFMICNHFWEHKNHVLAIDAFARVKKNIIYKDALLILTGEQNDPRNPRHFNDIKNQINKLNLNDCILLTGLISKNEQISLLTGTCALIQPTLHEGGPGGGSVYEAAGFGLPILLSDIPINREIEYAKISFFNPSNANELADRMIEILNQRYVCTTPALKDTQYASISKEMNIFFRSMINKND